MKLYALTAALVITAVSGSSSLQAMPQPTKNPRVAQASAPAVTPEMYRTMVEDFCGSCHNDIDEAGNVSFDAEDLATLAPHADVWEKAVRKLRAGMMPPPGRKRPQDPAALDAFATWLEQGLDREAAQNPDPGRIALHRLNRVEYGNAIEDLLAIRVDATSLLPKDDEADGFDNQAMSLRVSPSFLDQYISAARFVSTRALGTSAEKTQSAFYRPNRGTDQYRRVEGLPPGTRGGLVVEHLFPSDGEYKFNFSGMAGAFYVRGMEYQHTVLLLIDGVKVWEGAIGGEEDMKAIDQKQAAAVTAINARFQNISVPVKAGPHRVGVTFVQRSYAESDELLHSFRPSAGEDRLARVGGVEIVGPFNPSGQPLTPSRARILVCTPPQGASEAEELACARNILSTLARRAYRRPVTDADLANPLAFYTEARRNGDFVSSIQNGMMPILASPKFLFRAESVPAGVAPGANYHVSDLDLASRLSFFLWARQPDDELLQWAATGKLQDPAVLNQQVQRLLADGRARTLVTNFAYQWLKLRGLDDVEPDGVQFPNFDPSLREAFRREIEMFVESVIREDRSVLELMTGDYTFVNERLALHYGIPTVRGEAFQRVTLTDPNRWGVLGKGAVLMATSYGNRTAPVIRGAFILENILGTPPASPPPNVEGFPENKVGQKGQTIRAILEEHRANRTCNACHGVIDPLGFALENFDAIGAWRDKDRFAGSDVDGTGVLVDGSKVKTPRDLVVALTRRPEQFAQTFTEKLMTYAMGRRIEASDMPAVRKIVREAARDNYRFSAIVNGIVRSTPFQMRRAAPDTESQQLTQQRTQ